MTGERIVFRLCLAATLALWLAMSLWSMPRLATLGGGPIFDLRFRGYTAADAQELLTLLGSEGRAFYLDVQQRLDLVFPALLAVTLILWFRRMAPPRWALALSALALAATVLDYAENAAVRHMLVTATTEGVETASLRTQLKSVVGAIALAAALLLLLAAALRRFRR